MDNVAPEPGTIASGGVPTPPPAPPIDEPTLPPAPGNVDTSTNEAPVQVLPEGTFIISSQTLEILKNSSSINETIKLRGNKIKTFNPGPTILTNHTITENFPDFGIYDLPEFLGTLSLFDKSPELKFEGDFVTMSHGGRKVVYKKSQDNLLNLEFFENEIPFDDEDSTNIKFKMTSAMINNIKKASGLLGEGEDIEFYIIGDGNQIRITFDSGSGVVNVDGQNVQEPGNEYSEVVGETDRVFKAVILADSLLLINADYDVEIHYTESPIIRFTNNDKNLMYFVAVEDSSTFE